MRVQVYASSTGSPLSTSDVRVGRVEVSEGPPQVGTPVVLIHRYFAPDTPPYAQMLGAIAGVLSRGRRTRVVSGNVPYRSGTELDPALAAEATKSAEVVRVALLPESSCNLGTRALNGLIFAGKAGLLARRWGRGSIVMAATTPPVVVALAAAIGTRLAGGRFVYHNQDVYPEILGLPRSKVQALGFQVLRRMDAWTGRTADRIVVLSDDMKQLWLDRGLPAEKVRVIPNFVPEHFRGDSCDEPVRQPEDRDQTGSARLAYVGNLGPLQDLHRTFALIAGTPEVSCDVYGDGRQRMELEAKGYDNIEFHGQIPPDQVPAVLANCDLGVVALVPGVERAAYPSKIMTLLSCGIPLLAFVDCESSLAAEITGNGLGFVVDETAGQTLATALKEFSALSNEEKVAMQKRCLAYSKKFAASAVLNQWTELFGEFDGVTGRGGNR